MLRSPLYHAGKWFVNRILKEDFNAEAETQRRMGKKINRGKLKQT